MGSLAHHAVLVHDWQTENGNPERVAAFRAALPEAWQRLVVGPITTVVNGAKVYAFLPDGSKEGWPTSDEGDRFREEFAALFAGTYADVAIVRFGGDAPDLASVSLLSVESDDDCVHDWTLRPESDTWVCEMCGAER